MLNMFLFLAISFLLTIILGIFIEKLRIPWIFAALLLGSFLAIYNPFQSITSSPIFEFMAQLGMYLLLFIIGFGIDLTKLKKMKNFIIRATFVIILFEASIGTLIIHFIFGYSWLIAFIVSLSFATVGEAILVPILDEFKILNTKLGQSIIGIGTLDDIFEILILIFVVFLIGHDSISNTYLNIGMIIGSILLFIGIIFISPKFKKVKKFQFLDIKILFLFAIFLLFFFLGIGEYMHIEPIAALLSGIAVRRFLPKTRFKEIENELKAIVYGLFAPIFFLWVGLSMDINSIITYPFLVLLIVVASKASKLLGSYFVGRNVLGVKKSILLGIGLSVRFSTSIIIIKILFDNGLITSDLYSIIIASSIIFKFIVPILFSNLLVRWKIAKL
ncbi:MAG: cation:proton antiporter [Candidatus Aenigmarchaeota archaeon]|nr:cation:proton antiporter [Candidatus Aenigmarchaeota archaeon]